MSISSNLILEVLKDYGIVALVGGILLGYVVNSLTGGRNTGRFIGLLFVIVFLAIPIFRPLECEACGAQMQYGHTFCSTCGHEQDNGNILGKIKCWNCNSSMDKDDKICGYCGCLISDGLGDNESEAEIEH